MGASNIFDRLQDLTAGTSDESKAVPTSQGSTKSNAKSAASERGRKVAVENTSHSKGHLTAPSVKDVAASSSKSKQVAKSPRSNREPERERATISTSPRKKPTDTTAKSVDSGKTMLTSANDVKLSVGEDASRENKTKTAVARPKSPKSTAIKTVAVPDQVLRRRSSFRENAGKESGFVKAPSRGTPTRRENERIKFRNRDRDAVVGATRKRASDRSVPDEVKSWLPLHPSKEVREDNSTPPRKRAKPSIRDKHEDGSSLSSDLASVYRPYLILIFLYSKILLITNFNVFNF